MSGSPNPKATHSGNAGPSIPLWGDFGGMCLASSCDVTPNLFLPGAVAMGMPKSASFLLGTWQTEDGNSHRVLRGLEAYKTSPLFSVFSTRETGTLTHLKDVEVKAYRGGLDSRIIDGAAQYAPPAGGGFRHVASNKHGSWQEGDLLDVSGALIAVPTQWYNPWRSGGAYAVTVKYRARGTIFGMKADGFFAHETHFMPSGLDFMNSPFGFGGREVHWGHMATAFEDGTTVDASLAIGADGWGFALLTDENGNRFATTEIEVRADVRPNGYPERILYGFLGQEWIWEIAPHGERPHLSIVGPLGAEGTFRRVGDKRRIIAYMGTIDWWKDGREFSIPSI